MTRLLLYEPAYRRVEQRLPALSDRDELLLLWPDGSLWSNGQRIAAEDARPEIGWVSTDLFVSPAFGTFLATLLQSSALQWVQSGAAGFDRPVFRQFVERGARLTNNHSQAVGMAEYVLWGVLDHLQRGPERRIEQTAHRWTPLRFTEISGSRWLIIGFGAIGQAVGRRVRAFDAHVTGIRRGSEPNAHADAMATPDEIKALLPTSDVVVLSLPLSARTAGMVDAGFLAAMKPGSVLVNVGRGGLVDEAALLAALDRGVPAHAVLDVFQTEPLPAASPFWDHPRVMLTPHASPTGSGLTARSDTLFIDNLGRFLAGTPLLNEIDPKEIMAAGKSS